MKTIHLHLANSVRRTSTVALALTVLSAVLLGGVSVQATTYDWISANSDGYTNQAEWSPTGLPGISDTAIIGNSTQPNGSVVYTNLPPDPASTNKLSLLEMGTASGTSTFNMTGGVLLDTNASGTAFSLGDASGAIDTFAQSGGTLVVARPSTANDYYQDAFLPGDAGGGTGTYTNSGGLAEVLCGLEIGDAASSTGTVTVAGGTVIDNGWFGVGREAATATFNLMAGAMYILRNPENDGTGSAGGVSLCQGTPATGTANISGGNLYCTQLRFNSSSGSTETLNISGGSIYVGYIGVYWTGAAASQDINISGGTFHTADMLQVGSSTIGSTNTILSDGTNWSWWANLPVNLTNGTFSVNGVAGPGAVTFAPEANRTITLSNIWYGVGGMTMSGPGNLVLDGSNTFTGPLTVNGGLLEANKAQAAPLTVNGGSLEVSAAQSAPLTLNGGLLGINVASADTGGLTFNGGDLAILSGSLADAQITVPGGSYLVFTNSSALTFTNIVAGSGNVLVAGAGTVNVGDNLQNRGAIIQNNGALVVNGTILNAIEVTNSGPSSAGTFLAQGTITSPIGIGTNSAIEVGTTLPGTLNASNVVLNGTWTCKLNTATTPGGGTNDLLVCSNLTLGANSVLSINPLSTLSAGTYVIAEYSGTLTGAFGTLNAPRGTMSLSYSTPGEILLVVTSVNPGNLTWAAPIGASDINWDVNTSDNWTNTATSALSVFDQGDAVNFNAVPGQNITNRVSVTGEVLPSSITISGGLPYIFSGTGEIGGTTGITYDDTNTSGIYTSGNSFTGPVNIDAGILQLGSGGSSWLGATNSITTVNSGGTLDLDGQSVGSHALVLAGAGSPYSGTNGAINNSSSTEPNASDGPLNITLAGNTTFAATGARWDIGVLTLGAGGGSFTGNGYNLTKVGSQPIWMHEVGDIGVGDIDIQQGELGFEYTIGMGLTNDTVTAESGATLGLYQLSSNSILNKVMVLNGNATLASGGASGSSNNFIGPITLNGTNSITTSDYPLNLAGVISGTGGFTLSDTGPLYLEGTNTYTGPTFLANTAYIYLATNAAGGGSIGDSSLIELGTSSSNNAELYGASTTPVLDGSELPGGLVLNSGQTLSGFGTVNGNATAGAGSTIEPGSATAFGTMLFNNNLTLDGNTNIIKLSGNINEGDFSNDLIYVNGNLTLSGQSTIEIEPEGALTAGPYVIIDGNGSGISGSASNLRVISANPSYTFTPSISGNQVLISVTGNAAPLVWTGSHSGNWDLATANWDYLGTTTANVFFNGDIAIFNDSATATGVNVAAGVAPAETVMSNVVNTYTFTGAGLGGGSFNMEGNGSGAGGSVILATTNSPAFSTIDSSFGTLVYNIQGVTNYTVPANITDDAQQGAGTVIFGGSNVVVLEGNNANSPVGAFGGATPFDGTLEVTNGMLEYTNVEALGLDASVENNPAYAPLILTNNGAVNFNGVAVGASGSANLGGEKWIHISGSGYNGLGPIYDSQAGQEPNGPFCFLWLDGNVTINVGSNRIDQHVLTAFTTTAQQVEGNTNNLTFVGTGALFFNPQADGDTHFGNIDVASTIPGRLAFQGGPLALGPNTNYLMVESNAEVTFYSVTNEFDPVHAGIDKIMWLKGGAEVDSGGSSNNYIGDVFLSGLNLFGTRSDLHLWNNIMDTNGPGGYILGDDSVGASSDGLWLDGTNNTYSGSTIISNETLHVGADSSLGLSQLVQVGATLDLSAFANYSFGANQTVTGDGTIDGNLIFNSGGTLAVGLPTSATNDVQSTNTFTMTIDSNLVFNAGSTYDVGVNKTSAGAATNASDHVVGLNSVTMGGTLVITNYGAPFVGGDAIPLFSATTYVTNGFTAANIIPATPGPNLAWDTSTLGADGNLRVLSTITVNTNPTNITFSVSANQLTLSWPADHTGWELEAQTNSLSVGISTNWVPVSGSTASNSITIPLAPANASVFYRLVYPPQD